MHTNTITHILLQTEQRYSFLRPKDFSYHLPTTVCMRTRCTLDSRKTILIHIKKTGVHCNCICVEVLYYYSLRVKQWTNREWKNNNNNNTDEDDDDDDKKNQRNVVCCSFIVTVSIYQCTSHAIHCTLWANRSFSTAPVTDDDSILNVLLLNSYEFICKWIIELIILLKGVHIGFYSKTISLFMVQRRWNE